MSYILVIKTYDYMSIFSIVLIKLNDNQLPPPLYQGKNVLGFNFLLLIIIVGSQIVAHTQMKTGDGPNKPNTINL